MHKIRYFLQVMYRGTRYHGWQIQENATSIQGELQACLSQLFQQSVKVIGSSRTDKGVHAHQQWASMSVLEEVRVCIYPEGSAGPIQATLDELLTY